MSFQQNHSRRILPPVPFRKRKEREGNASSNGFKVPAPKAPKAPSPSPSPKAPSASSSNQLLAGYMAHEFLTKGTLLGQKFDPARAESVPLWSSSAEPREGKQLEAGKVEGAGSGASVVHESYAKVASILKTDGAHIPGIVNPTQLAKWIQM